MTIDKSISQYYDVPGTKKIKGQLHKLAYITPKEAKALKKMGGIETRTPEGILAYPGGAGTPGGYDGGSGSSSGGGGGGGGGEGGAAQRAAAQRAQAQLDADRLNAQRAAAAATAEAEVREAARERAIQTNALTPKTITETRHHSADTPTQIAEQKILDDYGYQDAKARAPTTLKPNVPYDRQVVWTGSPHGEHETGLRPTIVSNKYSPTYYQDKFGTRDRGSGIMGTVKQKSADYAKNMVRNKVMKELGLAGLNPLIGIGSWLMGKFAPNKKAALKSNITNLLTRKSDDLVGTADWQGEKKRITPREDRDGEATIAKQVAGGENVIAKAINQYAGTEAEGQIANLVKTDLNKALQYYSMMTPKIEAGKANKQEMDAYELLGYYLNEAAPKQQNVAYGGRIDKALGGRSRDI
jgi:hypothetical protein